MPSLKKKDSRRRRAPGYFGETGFTTVERLWTATLELNGVWVAIREGAKTSSAKALPNLDAARSNQIHAKCQARRKAYSKASAKTVHCRLSFEHGKPWSLHITPRFSEGQAAWKRLGRKAVSFAKASIPFVSRCMILQGSLRSARLRPPRREATPGRAYRLENTSVDQGHRPLLTPIWPPLIWKSHKNKAKR